MGTLLTTPPSTPLIAPSVLSADFGHMAEQARGVLDAGADLLHLDVMDGHFVPNLTMGPDLCAALRRALPDAFLDVHLMVTDPGAFFEPFADAGADHVTFHAEVAPGDAGRALIDRARALGMTVGVAVNPPSPLEPMLELLPHVDLALVMSVNPGFSGQSFLEPVLDKTRELSSRCTPTQRVQMDGGLGPTTAPAARAAGCDVLVAGSGVFGLPQSHWPERIAELRG